MWVVNWFSPGYDSVFEVYYNELGELVDSWGNYFSNEAGQIYDSAGNWVGTLSASIEETIEETREEIIAGAVIIAKHGANAAAFSAIVLGVIGIGAVYLLVK